ncbi:MAG: ABC transporter permease [Bacilli bacterium]|nr:ABC transporter permease [Bacilli bacterium]
MANRSHMRKSSSRDWNGGVFYALYIPLILLLFYLPIFSVMLFSFNAAKSATVWGGFSTYWYEYLFSYRELKEALWTTVSIALLATLISTVIGTIGSIGLAELAKKQKNFVSFLLSVNNLPVVNPDIVTAVSLSVLFLALMKDSMGYMTMLLAHIAFCTPYVIIQVYPKVQSLDPAEMEAAMDLGATKHQAIRKVVIPDLAPSILSGAMMAFTMSFDDFVISYFVGGKVMNISMFVYNMKKFNPVVNALSTLIFLTIGIVLVGFEIIRSKMEHNEDEEISRKKKNTRPVAN